MQSFFPAAADLYVQSMEFLADLCGIAALAVTTLGLCLKSDRLLRILNLTGVFFWATHFALIEAWAACGMLILAAVMICSSMLGWTRTSNAALLFNVALLPATLLLVVLGQAQLASLSPVVGGLLINVGISRCRGHTMTAMIGAGEASWVITGILVGSPAAVIANLLSLSALGIRTLRKILDTSAPADAGAGTDAGSASDCESGADLPAEPAEVDRAASSRAQLV